MYSPRRTSFPWHHKAVKAYKAPKQQPRNYTWLPAAKFDYDELPCASSLRILSLAPGQSTEPLVVSLETVPGDRVAGRLAGCEALSYVWGAPKRTQVITCNGAKLRITPNLDVALRAIRSTTTQLSLWADAICINQDNSEERNHQIKLMTQIYSTARRVLVWLGHHGDDEKTIFRDAHKLIMSPSFAQKMLNNRFLNRLVIRFLQELASRPWFDRMWTLQEIGLASEAIFVYGSARLSWQKLHSAYQLFEQQFPGKFLRQHAFEPSRVTWLYGWRSGQSGESFLKTLVATETRHSSDPRDRVFALLSHPSATVVTLNQSTELIIEPDYRKTAIEIYALLAERLVCTSRCLDVLSYINGDEKDYNLPTWAPLWSERTKTSACLIDWHIQFAADGNIASDEQITWNLTESQGFKECEPCINHDGQLCVASVVVGKVSFCSERASAEHCYQCAGQVDLTRTPQKLDTKDLCLHHGFALLLEQVNHTLPNHAVTRPVETIGEVLTCGCVLPQHELRVTNKESHTHHFKNYLRVVLRRAVGTASLQAFELPFNFSFDDNPYRIAADRACEGRVLFCTDTGFIGLGPAALRIGDEAYILKGGKVPYILRQVNDGHHNVIGECYISGAMHGEVLSSSKFDVSQIAQKIIV